MIDKLLNALLAFIGAVYFIGLFWLVCRVVDWEVPYWAYFIVGWMGHNDFHDALKKESA